MKKNRASRSGGFTLVELLVVIVIVAVLVTVSITGLFRFRKAADKTVAVNNLRQIQAANVAYAGEQNGRFVPPTGTVDAVSYKWYENPNFVSQLKGNSATYNTGGAPDTSLEASLMDPAVARAKAAGYKSLAKSYGYTSPDGSNALRQAQLDDASRSAAFITATDGFADFGAKANIAYRHDNKAIVVYYDGHAEAVTRDKIASKAVTDIFWPPVNVVTP